MKRNHATAIALAFTLVCSVHALDARAADTVYRLNDATNYTEGCFDPCDCPLFLTEDVTGTFVLTPPRVGGNVFKYKVRDVNWFVGTGDSAKHVTGDGTYTRISGVAGWSHQLTLKLSIDHGDAVKFDSGLVPGGGDFPNITGLTLSMNNLFCYDIAIAVDASPVPADEIICYALKDTSTYQEGCLPPCLCPILMQMLLTGNFALVPLSDAGTVQEFAVINVDLKVVSPFPGPPPSSKFKGYGKYTRISGIAGWMHRMHLDLSIDGGPRTAFDSGLVNGGSEFPEINIAIARNGFFCYDIVLDINAAPSTTPCP